MKVGIFGGTFNPPHNTHIQLAQFAKNRLSLDKLIVVPCGTPPHKPCEVSPEARLDMTRKAFAGIAEVSDFEIVKHGKSYTVETLRHFKTLFPKAQLFLVMGGDSYRNFGGWYRPEEIAALATLAVAERPCEICDKQRQTFGIDAQTVFLDAPVSDVSSTEIRLRYQFGLANGNFVPDAVDEYVLNNGLYAGYGHTVQKLKTYLDEKRFMHTFYVVKRGLELAGAEDDRNKVFLACLLHDCAKNMKESDCLRYGFAVPEDMPEPVVHSFLGALVARQDFGVTDGDVLDAIAYHTTGCPGMTRLQKIVYVADKTEQTRPYPIKHLLQGTLDEQFVRCLMEANSYTAVCHTGKEYSLSRKTLDFYCRNLD
ncbi:MAG: nicotinate (nicotinamide) nucleotide adenylyltransferase [Corallococcus sp.]|nr:nicotinate (nicotinamide) nucleotide adenylyltransferase [Corallococcus sp.]MCM1359394.1 nicotinate (nicotinamide) nucleotide adenylyltransferase [Corallococcus sp.]MCM1394837.1 nicotinate (nicotinamide) nucleotide adenylyltransferase [Corallococcus sp.]